MGLSGFLYVAIVVGWAVYLVPFALKRYDEATRNRSIDRFSSAMRVLGRHEVEDAEAAAQTRPRPVVSPQARDAARQAARRRRRVLLVLLLSTAVVAGLAAGALTPWWSVAVPGVLVLLWLTMCRRQARREYGARPARVAETVLVADEEPAPRRDLAPAEERVAGAWPGDPAAGAQQEAEQFEAAQYEAAQYEAAQYEAARYETARYETARYETARYDAGRDEVDVAMQAAPADDEPTVVLGSDGADDEMQPVGSGSLWDPVPVTLPTYVHKPRAPRTIRTIDLGASDVQSSGRKFEESAIYTHHVDPSSLREQDDRDAEAGEPTEEHKPTRRAVGE